MLHVEGRDAYGKQKVLASMELDLVEDDIDTFDDTPVKASRVLGPRQKDRNKTETQTGKGNGSVGQGERKQQNLPMRSHNSQKVHPQLQKKDRKPDLDSFCHQSGFQNSRGLTKKPSADSDTWRSSGRRAETSEFGSIKEVPMMPEVDDELRQYSNESEVVCVEQAQNRAKRHLRKGRPKAVDAYAPFVEVSAKRTRPSPDIKGMNAATPSTGFIDLESPEHTKLNKGTVEGQLKKQKLGKRRVVLDDSDEDEEVKQEDVMSRKVATHVHAIDLCERDDSTIDQAGGRVDSSPVIDEFEKNKFRDGDGNNSNVSRAGRHLGRIQKKGEAEKKSQEDEVELEGVDPISAALRTCERIAAELQAQLQFATKNKHSTAQEQFAEVEGSAMQLVSQMDVSEACGGDHVQLKPYQLVGVNFLLLLYRQGGGGAILADEMGLGKTVQAISFLAVIAQLEHDPGPHLVVAPASLLENWQRELKRWCPNFTTVLYHGSERANVRQDYGQGPRSGSATGFNVMLTCYSLFERDSAMQKQDRTFLRKFDFSCVLMDEAHLLKDRSATRTKKLWSVAGNARHRIMLTGTPLQNDLQELWSLLEFLMPAIFGTRGCDLSEYLGSRDTTGEITTGGSSLIGRIKGILGPFVLRRVKADVMKQLVPKVQQVEFVEMDPEQAVAYTAAIEQYRETVAARAASKAMSITTGLTEVNLANLLPKRQVANIFTQLRKVANHPLLVRRLYTDESLARIGPILHRRGAFGYECSEQRVLDEIKEYSDFSIHQLCAKYKGALANRELTDKHVMASGKCQALAQLLPKLKKDGHRPLIFSQWTAMMDILEWALDVLGLPYVRLDGSTQVSERQALVDQYNGDPDIFAFLLSTRAGGQGLNLTGADTVILHDVDFNPQVDRQAEDRCHRIGQTKPVTVYRLVSKGTVDENILSIAQRKLSLDAAVLDPTSENKAFADSDARTMGDILSSILGAKGHQ